MKKIIIIKRILLFLTVLSVGLAACAPLENQSSGRETSQNLKVLAVESFLADIAQNVAGERAQVESLMPDGIDPHAFEPTPRDVARISDSNVLIINGAGLEVWLDEVVGNAGGERLVIEASAGIPSRTPLNQEQAVLSPQEKAGLFCDSLSGTDSIEETAWPEADSAIQADPIGGRDDHLDAFISLDLDLTGSAGGQYGGFLAAHLAERGDFQIAIPDGNLFVSSGDGSLEYKPEETITLDCGGLTKMLVFELEAGDYIFEFANFTAQRIPVAAGQAGGHQHVEGDPHYWLDPNLVIKYVETIRDGLIQADPDGQVTYTRNADQYITRLQELDQYIQKQVSVLPKERRVIVTNHESFGYFADRYGFTIIGTVIPSVSSGATPSAQQLASLVDHIKETGAIAIFVETGANPQLARQIAEETGVSVVTDLYTHSITGLGGDASGYIEMMKYNVSVIVNALK